MAKTSARCKDHLRLSSDSDLIKVSESKNTNSGYFANSDNDTRSLRGLVSRRIPYVKLRRIDLVASEPQNESFESKVVIHSPLSETLSKDHLRLSSNSDLIKVSESKNTNSGCFANSEKDTKRLIARKIPYVKLRRIDLVTSELQNESSESKVVLHSPISDTLSKDHLRRSSDSDLIKVSESKNTNSGCFVNSGNDTRSLIALVSRKIPYVKLRRIDLVTSELQNESYESKVVTPSPLSETLSKDRLRLSSDLDLIKVSESKKNVNFSCSANSDFSSKSDSGLLSQKIPYVKLSKIDIVASEPQHESCESKVVTPSPISETLSKDHLRLPSDSDLIKVSESKIVNSSSANIDYGTKSLIGLLSQKIPYVKLRRIDNVASEPKHEIREPKVVTHSPISETLSKDYLRLSSDLDLRKISESKSINSSISANLNYCSTSLIGLLSKKIPLLNLRSIDIVASEPQIESCEPKVITYTPLSETLGKNHFCLSSNSELIKVSELKNINSGCFASLDNSSRSLNGLLSHKLPFLKLRNFDIVASQPHDESCESKVVTYTHLPVTLSMAPTKKSKKKRVPKLSEMIKKIKNGALKVGSANKYRRKYRNAVKSKNKKQEYELRESGHKNNVHGNQQVSSDETIRLRKDNLNLPSNCAGQIAVCDKTLSVTEDRNLHDLRKAKDNNTYCKVKNKGSDVDNDCTNKDNVKNKGKRNLKSDCRNLILAVSETSFQRGLFNQENPSIQENERKQTSPKRSCQIKSTPNKNTVDVQVPCSDSDLNFQNAIFQKPENEDKKETVKMKRSRKKLVRAVEGDADTKITVDNHFSDSNLNFKNAVFQKPTNEDINEPENIKMERSKRRRVRTVSGDTGIQIPIDSDLNFKKAINQKPKDEYKYNHEPATMKINSSEKRLGKTVARNVDAEIKVDSDFSFKNVIFQKPKNEDNNEPENIMKRSKRRQESTASGDVNAININSQIIDEANAIEEEKTVRSEESDAKKARPIDKTEFDSQDVQPGRDKAKHAKKRRRTKNSTESGNSELVTKEEAIKGSYLECENDELISKIPPEKFKHNNFQKDFDVQISPHKNSSAEFHSGEENFDFKYEQDESPKLESSHRKRHLKRKMDWEIKMKGVKLNSHKKPFLDDNLVDSDSSFLKKSSSVENYNFGGSMLSESVLKESPRSSRFRKEILNNLSGIINSYSTPKYGCLEDRVYKLLSNSCFKRLRHVVQTASKHQLRNGHDMLTTNDFQRGLLLCGEEPVSNAYVQAKRKGRPGRINLPQPLHSKKSQPLLAPFPAVTEFWVEQEDPLDRDSSEIPDDLKVYFQLISNALENGAEPCTLAFDDLKSNKNILVLIPHFVSLISSQILTNINDFTKLSVAIEALASLFLNPFLHFDASHFETFAYLLLKCLLSSSHSFQDDSDFQLLKDKTADLLNQVLKRSRSKKLWFELLFLLEAAFCDEGKSLITHYGVLKAINSMGVFAIMIAVIPHVDRFVKYLDCVSIENAHVHQSVKGQLLQSCHQITYYTKHKNSNERHYSEEYVTEEEKQIPLHCLEQLSDYLGNGFDLLIPSLSYVFTPNRIKKNVVPKVQFKKLPRSQGRKSKVSDSCQRNLAFELVPLVKHSITFKLH